MNRIKIKEKKKGGKSKINIVQLFFSSLSYSGKLIWLLIIFLLLFVIVFPALYYALYYFLENAESSVLWRYASSSKFDNNIFMNQSVPECKEMFNQLVQAIEEFDQINGLPDYANTMINNKDEVLEIINRNSAYLNYLKDNGTSVDEFFQWCQQIVDLQSRIIQSSVFIVFLIYSCIIVGWFKCRKTFYVFAGIVYTLTTISLFSGGISDSLLQTIYKDITRSTVELNNIDYLIIQAFKESMLAFIIFDAILQIRENNKEQKSKEFSQMIKDAIYAIDSNIFFLQKYSYIQTDYCLNIKIPIETIVLKAQELLYSTQNRIKKIKNHSSIRYIDLELQKTNLQELIEDAEKISGKEQCNNSEEYILILSDLKKKLCSTQLYK
ncbi:MAG: hypothetical protein Q4F95_07850 [Oscillospiraceae bacterium]|nr:hypothetical protein [Oscillospiraceae bacterium]